ncbi:myrcene synthase, partial [Quercus suber]
GKSYTRRANEQKEEVRMMLEKVVDLDVINKLLKSISDKISNNDTWDKEVFRSFIDEFGEFKEHLCKDIE